MPTPTDKATHENPNQQACRGRIFQKICQTAASSKACQDWKPRNFWQAFGVSLGLSLMMTSLALAYKRWQTWKKP